MRIAFVNNNYQLGGAETVAQQLFQACRYRGYTTAFYVADGKTYPADVSPLYPRWLSYLAYTRWNGLVSKVFPKPQWTDRAFRQLADAPFDLIHLHSFHGLYATIESLAYLASKKTVIWTFHRFWGITGGCDHPFECNKYNSTCGSCPQLGIWPIGKVDTTAQQLQQKLTYLRDAPLHIISPSQHLLHRVKTSLVGQNWKSCYIPNGVNPALFRATRKHDPEFRQQFGLEQQTTVILLVNRSFKDPLKGFSIIKRALEQINPIGVSLLLAGGETEWAEAQIPVNLRSYNQGYVSSREKIAQLYEVADIFLYASLGENFPCATLEAMAAENCIVSTPIEGVLEQVENGVTGWLSEQNTGDSLAQTLQHALDHPEECQRLGKAAREKVNREFSEEVMIQHHLALYQKLASTQ
jgi:glycosyltransferase involved in cell wall biosynthesis